MGQDTTRIPVDEKYPDPGPLVHGPSPFGPKGAQAIIALIAFGLCASGVYVLNDLLDQVAGIHSLARVCTAMH